MAGSMRRRLGPVSAQTAKYLIELTSIWGEMANQEAYDMDLHLSDF